MANDVDGASRAGSPAGNIATAAPAEAAVSIRSAASLDAAARATFGELADALLPSCGEMPAASEVGVPGRGLDLVVGVRPDLLATLVRIVAAAAAADEAPREFCERLRRQDRSEFSVLATAVAAAYYLEPEVMKLIGYRGQQPVVPEPEAAERDLGGGLLDAVLQRGPIYRPTPG